MILQPRIVTVKEKKLVGKSRKMSLLNNQTFELWRSFMPERRNIKNQLSSHLISMRVYEGVLQPDDLAQNFYKWAAVEVSQFDAVPSNMEMFVLNGGLYAVFEYQGLHTDNRIFIYIFKDWLPNSSYDLDERPHFEVLGENYKNNDPNSQEEIWIPIRLKK